MDKWLSSDSPQGFNYFMARGITGELFSITRARLLETGTRSAQTSRFVYPVTCNKYQFCNRYSPKVKRSVAQREGWVAEVVDPALGAERAVS
jgi:hypothetical protein